MHNPIVKTYVQARILAKLTKKGIRVKDVTPYKDGSVVLHLEDSMGTWMATYRHPKKFDVTTAMPVPVAV